MDNLDFLDSPEGGNDAAQPVETAVEQPKEEAQPQPEAEQPQEEQPKAEPPPSRERDEKGRFKPKEEPKDGPVMVPLSALHETRDKVKALEAQLAQFSQPQQQPQPIPDVFENPDGFYQHIQQQIAQTALNDRLNLSEEMTRQAAGDEAVNAAQEWGRQQFAANPALAQQFYQQRNPYGFLVQQYQRQQALETLGDDPKEIEAFKAWKAAQAQLQQQPNTDTPNPPKSIASATSAGGLQNIATGPTVAFDNVFRT